MRRDLYCEESFENGSENLRSENVRDLRKGLSLDNKTGTNEPLSLFSEIERKKETLS